ncbi:MAG: SUMF1/EgtB/PvdO family nonheme iron enzyme [Anaerolineae bacterium]
MPAKKTETAPRQVPVPHGYGWLVDVPTVHDRLGFAPFRRALRDIITKTPETPFTIGVFGTWGSGKTSLMLMLQDDLRRANQRRRRKENKDKYRLVWFDAWKYSQEELLWRTLLLRVLAALRPRREDGQPKADKELSRAEKELCEELDRLEESLYRDVDWEEKGSLIVDIPEALKAAGGGLLKLGFAVLPGVGTVFQALRLADKAAEAAQGKIGEGALGEDVAGLLKAFRRDVIQHHQQHLASLEQFQKLFADLVKKYVVGQDQRLVLFVDDLDRCLPEKAVEVLEAIKLFLDVPGCVFVLGLERKVIEEGIRVKYRDFVVVPGGAAPIVGRDYLEKIIQVPFNLPPIDSVDIRTFICQVARRARTSGLRPTLEAQADIFATGLEANPRRIKRALGTFQLLLSLAEYQAKGQKSNIVPGLLAKLVVIQTSFPELYEECVRRPQLLLDLEADVQQRGTEVEVEAESTAPRTLVEKYGRERRLRAMLDKRPLFAEQPDPLAAVRDHIYLTRTTREAGYTAPTVEADVWSDLISGDPTRAQDAAARVGKRRRAYVSRLRQLVRDTGAASAERAGAAQALRWLVQPDDPDIAEVQRELVAALEDGDTPLAVRLAAGEALAYLGDPRDFDEMIEIPAGEFLYSEDKKPIYLNRFKIGKYPVTNAQYKRFLDANPRYRVPYEDADWARPYNWDREKRTYPEGKANHPVVLVSWNDAQAYCNWLKKTTGWDFRLPTEEEWEKAARGTDGREWPWGNEFHSEKANTVESGIGDTTPVGCYPDSASPYGCLDMAGNVWEWTASEDEGGHRVLRGGSWYGKQYLARCAFRLRHGPASGAAMLGFGWCLPLCPDCWIAEF